MANQKVIDIHCHLFNLKYLPVAGVLKRYGGKYISHSMARGIEWLLLNATEESFPKQPEKIHSLFEDEDYSIPLYQYLGEEKFAFGINQVFGFNVDESITAIENMALVGDILSGPLSEALDDYQSIFEADSEPFGLTQFMTKSENISFRAGIFRRMLNFITEKVESLVNYLKWFVFMTNSEEAIFKHLTERDAPNVDKYLHLMMDVDHFFNNNTSELRYRSYYDFPLQQISNMQQLNILHPNLICFVAFNPARKDSLEIVKNAIEFLGFKGVKFYPPMGYRASGDNQYGEQIEALLIYCSENRVPLFTHCNNQGFEAKPNGGHSGYNSNPKYWEEALKRYPDLILCLGHAGGTQGWFSANQETDKLKAIEISEGDIMDDSREQDQWNNSYAAMVFKLCIEYNNVYCDASYLDEMIESSGHFDPAAKENFKSRLIKLFNSEPKLATRIMYGSDWHMLFQEGKNNVYLKNYVTFFNEKELAPYSENFFYNNALNFLNHFNQL